MVKTNIVLLPGWGFHPTILHPIAKSLENKYQVHVLALDNLTDLPPRAILIGWSLGGMLAIKLAHQHPDRFLKVITIATNPCFIATEQWPGVTPENFAEFELKRESEPEKLLRHFALLQTTKKHYSDIKKFLCHPPLPSLDPLKHDLREIIKNFSNPLLFILGGEDKLVPPEVGERITHLNSGIKINIIPQASHIPFLLKLDEVMVGIHDFL